MAVFTLQQGWQTKFAVDRLTVHFDFLHLQKVLVMASAGVLFTVLGSHIVSMLCVLTDLITK